MLYLSHQSSGAGRESHFERGSLPSRMLSDEVEEKPIHLVGAIVVNEMPRSLDELEAE